jgi:RimJ/RimL family protein N-acetyltransferase
MELWSHPEVSRHITSAPQTREACWSRILRYIGHWQAMGYGYWIVERTSDNAFVGELGFGCGKREITPPLTNDPEIGWVLTPTMQGQGYATEAATTALTWRDTTLPPGPTNCIISPHNTQSLKLATRLGFSVVTETHYNDHEIRILKRP